MTMMKRLLLSLCICLLTSVAFAQETLTIATANGILIDYPESWTMEQDPDFESSLQMNDGRAMFGFINILPQRAVREDAEDVLDEIRDDIEDFDGDEIGEFGDIEEYTLGEEAWEVARTTRIRSDDRLIEMILAAEVRDQSIFLRVNFRIGSQESYYAAFDELISTVRAVDDDIPVTTGSFAQTPLTDGSIGTITDPLNLGALNTTYITREERYQFNYPATWDIQRVGILQYTLFRDTADTILFGNLALFETGELTNTERLQTILPDDTLTVETFMLNDLPAVRVVIQEETDNVRRLIMSTTRGEVQSLLDVRLNIDAPDTIEATLRAILYSVRTTGTDFALSAAGSAARTGLTSAGIYGAPVIPTENLTEDENALDATYVTLNGFFTFNYPSSWFLNFSNGSIVLTNTEDYTLYELGREETQMVITFLDQLAELDIDDYSPFELLMFIIDNDPFREDWSDITEFESAERRAAYSDFDFFSSDTIGRTFFVELDDSEDVLVRMDFVVDEDDLEMFMPIATAILETARFED